MATTPRYGWVTPAPTDFVTDLPADFEVFADAVDESLYDVQTEVIINAQTGTSYTLVLTDAGKLITTSNASPVTVTIPLNSSVAFPLGTRIDVLSIGAGITSIAATGGVTLSSKDSNKKLTKQGSAGSLIKTGTDTWWLVGDLSA